MENITGEIIIKKVKGEIVKTFTTSELFVQDYRDRHNGKYPQYDKSEENKEFRERYERLRKSLKNKYAKNYSMTYENIYLFYELHYKAVKRQNFAKCLAIEDVFCDINYHYEAGILPEGKYKDAVEYTKKEEEENKRYWEEQKRLEKERQQQEDALVEVLKNEDFRVLVSTEGHRTLRFSYKTGLESYIVGELCPVNFDSMRDYCERFNVDEEVDRLRQSRSYREQFSIRGMLEEIEKYQSSLNYVLGRAQEIYKNNTQTVNEL